MKKAILKNQKGFSLVELLVALLIMAVIAAAAITLFGGVLDTSKGGADRETAESIKRAILNYMNASNDVNLSCLDQTSSESFVNSLACTVSVDGTGANLTSSAITPPAGTIAKDGMDLVGTYGPFLDATLNLKPQQLNMTGWEIKIDSVSQAVTVASAATGSVSIN